MTITHSHNLVMISWSSVSNICNMKIMHSHNLVMSHRGHQKCWDTEKDTGHTREKLILEGKVDGQRKPKENLGE